MKWVLIDDDGNEVATADALLSTPVRLECNDGDILMFEYPRSMTDEVANRILSTVKADTGHRVMLIRGGIRFVAVIPAADIEKV
jgi:hypothetical protein